MLIRREMSQWQHCGRDGIFEWRAEKCRCWRAMGSGSPCGTVLQLCLRPGPIWVTRKPVNNYHADSHSIARDCVLDSIHMADCGHARRLQSCLLVDTSKNTDFSVRSRIAGIAMSPSRVVPSTAFSNQATNTAPRATIPLS